MGEAWPEIEYEDCYPVDEGFSAFTAIRPPLSFKDADAIRLRGEQHQTFEDTLP